MSRKIYLEHVVGSGASVQPPIFMLQTIIINHKCTLYLMTYNINVITSHTRYEIKIVNLQINNKK